MTKTMMLCLTLPLMACAGKERDCKQVTEVVDASGVAKVEPIPAAGQRHLKPAETVSKLRAYARTLTTTRDALMKLELKTPEIQTTVTAYVHDTAPFAPGVDDGANKYEKYAQLKAQDAALFASLQGAYADLVKACTGKDPGCQAIRAAHLPATANDPWGDFMMAFSLPKLKDAQAQAKLEALQAVGEKRGANEGALKGATENVQSADQELDGVVAKERPLAAALSAICAAK